ncbi:MAG: Uma2 family endonuclease [Selenomonadaceae bacterium]|nr:Uma2 family endonuclease [Selenomonadaceae bacterium]MBR1859724.1 Uma2 family endonuclease [Selenomonadaceae bacterium]
MDSALAYKSEREDYEIINGQAYMMARPSTNHMLIEKNVVTAFQNYLKGKRCIPFNEVDVFFNDEDNFIPDVIIVCDPDIIEDDGIHGTPDLVVEIASPSTARRDRMEKFAAYEKYGVKEYWLISPNEKRVEVYIRKDDKLILDNIYSVYRDYEWKRLTDEEKAAVCLEIKVSLYDDFYVKLEDIFEDIK